MDKDYDPEKIIERVNETEVLFQPIYTRMDADYDKWALAQVKGADDYAITTKTFQGARDTEVNFISNKPRTFADHVHARITNAERQIIVRVLEKEGEDKRDDEAKLERLIAFALDKADERLTNDYLYPPLLDYLAWCAEIRGRMCARILVEKTKGGVLFNFMPFDPRFVKYQVGFKGMSWLSYTTYRSAAEIEDEWEYKDAKNKTNNEVLDVWINEKPGKIVNCVICDKTLLTKIPQKHKLNSLPILYLPVPNVPPIRDKSGLMTKHGDSIYAGVRDIFEFENDLVSMWASHAQLLYKQPTINYYDEEGKELTTTAFLAEEVINLPMGHNKLEPSPLKEISPTLVELTKYIHRRVEEGTLPELELGAMGYPPPSGTAINEIRQAAARVYGPLIRSFNIFYTNIGYQIESQLISLNKAVTVKTEFEQKYYEATVEPVDLKVAHKIRAEFVASTPWTQLDTYQIAQMAKQQGLPDQFIWEYILKVPDPKGLTDLAAVEIAEHSPTLMRLKAIKTLLTQGREEEAKPLIEELYNEWLQEQEAQPQSPYDQAMGQMSEAVTAQGATPKAPQVTSA